MCGFFIASVCYRYASGIWGLQSDTKIKTKPQIPGDIFINLYASTFWSSGAPTILSEARGAGREAARGHYLCADHVGFLFEARCSARDFNNVLYGFHGRLQRIADVDLVFGGVIDYRGT